MPGALLPGVPRPARSGGSAPDGRDRAAMRPTGAGLVLGGLRGPIDPVIPKVIFFS
ncbi:hypothetical protein STXM2123_2234 [Streptomyces sp. F-3]|nr:hypothetical protein STXM2123_2234 [Streptomyces sp. F-3]